MIRLFFGAVFALVTFAALTAFPFHVSVASFMVEHPMLFAACIAGFLGAGLMAMMNR